MLHIEQPKFTNSAVFFQITANAAFYETSSLRNLDDPGGEASNGIEWFRSLDRDQQNEEVNEKEADTVRGALQMLAWWRDSNYVLKQIAIIMKCARDVSYTEQRKGTR